MLLQQRGMASAEALRWPRYELIPIDGVLKQVPYLPANATVTVTCSAARGIEPTIELVEHLTRLGYRSTPHLAARSIESDDHLDEIVGRLTGAGVSDVYVIGGDSEEPAGPFPDAESLLQAIAGRGNPFTDIGIAGYPEGHPLIETGRLWNSMKAKQHYATYLVTQMCFDASVIVDWVTEARQHDISLPIWVGLPGVASTAQIVRIAGKIGVGQSMRFLRKNLGLVSRFFRPGLYEPDELIEALDERFRTPTLDLRGFHVYTFNSVDSTERWRRRRLPDESD